MSKRNRLRTSLALLLAWIWIAPANASLYLLLNVGDTEDIEAGAAGETMALVMKGNRPARINSQAERYFVHVPHATTEVISGRATAVNATPVAKAPAAAIQSVAEISGDAAATEDDSGDTEWVKYKAVAASLMLFSPDGLDEESEIRFEPAYVYVRRLDGEIYLMITGKNGSPPR